MTNENQTLQYDLKMSLHEWELSDLADEDGLIGRSVPAGQIVVPGSIVLQDDALKWELQGKGTRCIEPDRRMLNHFVRLCDKPAEAIVLFAKHWGVLNVDHRNRPEAMKPLGLDPVEAWHFYSRRAKTLLNLIASFRRSGVDTEGKASESISRTSKTFLKWLEREKDTWMQFCFMGDPREEVRARKFSAARRFPLPIFADFPRNAREARSIIAREVNTWMTVWRSQSPLPAESDFRVQETKERTWEMRIDFHGLLFPAIAFQLCLIAVNADALYCCSGCGNPYLRPRYSRSTGLGRKRPRADQANYCEVCVQLKIPARRASEKYRQAKTRRQEMAAGRSGKG